MFLVLSCDDRYQYHDIPSNSKQRGDTALSRFLHNAYIFKLIPIILKRLILKMLLMLIWKRGFLEVLTLQF